MSSRPGYYSGRGVNRGDLNESHLELIWAGINTDFGAAHADNFVHFVNSLTDMSATAFLVALESFYASGCALREYVQRAGDGNTLSGRGRELEAEAMGCIFSALGRSNVSPAYEQMQSNGIKLPFVTRHGVKPVGKDPALMFDDGIDSTWRNPNSKGGTR